MTITIEGSARYGRVTGTFGKILADKTVQPLNGNVVFEPIQQIHRWGSESPQVITATSSITCPVIDGVLYAEGATSEDLPDEVGASILAKDQPNGTPSGASYKVTFALVGASIPSLATFWVNEGETVDLASVLPSAAINPLERIVVAAESKQDSAISLPFTSIHATTVEQALVALDALASAVVVDAGLSVTLQGTWNYADSAGVPSWGGVAFDNDIIVDAESISFYRIDADGRDKGTLLEEVPSGSVVFGKRIGGEDQRARFVTTGPATVESDVVTLPVQWVTSHGDPINGWSQVSIVIVSRF